MTEDDELLAQMRDRFGRLFEYVKNGGEIPYVENREKVDSVRGLIKVLSYGFEGIEDVRFEAHDKVIPDMGALTLTGKKIVVTNPKILWYLLMNSNQFEVTPMKKATGNAYMELTFTIYGMTN